MMTNQCSRSLALVFATVLLGHLISVAALADISAPYLVGNFDDRRLVPGFQAGSLSPFDDGRMAVWVGRRLWITDGTRTGTERLCTPPLSGGADCPPVERVLAADAARLFFLSGERLWITDGTVENTRALTDPSLRFESGLHSDAILFHTDRGLFFFSAHHPLFGSELWVSDGTPGGTRMLGDLAPGPLSSSPEFGGVVGDRVVFSADGNGGREPWVTDGTPEGTRLLREIQPGPGSSFPSHFRSLGDRVVFSAVDPLRGRELWVTNGTPEGTEPLPEVVPGTGDLFPIPADEAAPSGLFFRVRVGPEVSLWITDGTSAGTREIRNFGRQTNLDPKVAGDRAFFAIDNAVTGREPWVSDGTPGGTRQLGDLCPGPCSSNPGPFSAFGTHVFFIPDDGDTGREPWVSDGTPAGTRRLGDLAPGSVSSRPFFLAGNDHRLFFFAGTTPTGMGGLWVSEAPFDTAVPLFDPDTGRPSGLETPVLLGDDLLVLARDAEHGVALWRSDGTVEGTRPVRTLIEPTEVGSHPTRLTRVGERVFFTTGDLGLGFAATLWRTGGTPDSTAPVLEVGPAPAGLVRDFRSLTPVEDRLIFLLHNDVHNLDLWASDGTPENTRRLARDVDNIRVDAPLSTTGGTAFFLGFAAKPGAPSLVRTLWVTDGTPDGTRRLREIRFEDRAAVGVFQDRFFFAGARPGTLEDYELWVSDGTPEGTVLMGDLFPEGPSNPRHFTPAGDLLFFTADTPDGRRLWRTDGTPEGTGVVDQPAEAETDLGDLSALGDRLLFTSFARDDFTLEERVLWSTDGTREGTTRLTELRSRNSSSERERFVVGDELFLLDFHFSFDLGPSLIWRTDGTPEGTLPWRFLPSDREPVAFHAVDDGLVIEATGPAGRELWWSGDLSSAELVGAFANVGEPTRLGDLVLFRGTSQGLGSELWAFEVEHVEVQPPVRPAGVPDAPDRLEVFATGNGGLTAVWRDRSTNETSFVLEARSPLTTEFETVAVLPADATRVRLGIEPIPYTFRVRAENANGVSAWSAEASARSHFDLEACVASDEHLCLLGGRFEVLVSWRDPFNGGQGIGHAVPFDFSDDSGTFWFFDPANVELVVKVLDARSVNGFHWVFYGALSNVEYWVTVRDLLEGTSRTYHNPAKNLCGSGDTRAFPRPGPPPLASPDETVPLVVVETPEPIPPAAISPAITPESTSGSTGGVGGDCAESDTALCLTAERFRVEVEWRDPRSGDTGVGFAIPGTDDSGFFWFFDPENVELVVKVLDAQTVNGHFWVFFGGLSDVEYTITITDTVENVARQYRNEPFDICGQADTAAF